MSENEITPDHEELDALVAGELTPEDVADLAGIPAQLRWLQVHDLVDQGLAFVESGRVARAWAQAMCDVLEADDPRAAAGKALRDASVEEFLARSRRVMIADELKRRREAGLLKRDAPCR